MAIINFNNINFIDINGNVTKRPCPIRWLDRYEDRQYWIVEFFNNKSIYNLELAISETIIETIRDSNLTLLLSNTHEGYHNSVDAIYEKVIIGWKISENKVIIASESADINVAVNKSALKYGRKPIESWWTHIFEHNAVVQLKYDVNHIKLLKSSEDTLVSKQYDKKFLCFNRYWRPHRPILIALLKIKNILDKGHISLKPIEGHTGWDRAWHDMIDSQPLRENNELVELLNKHKEEIVKIPPMSLDHNHEHISPQLYEIIGNNNIRKLYTDTYFSVVTETTYVTTGWCDLSKSRILSEKTFKAIGNKHPFILVTVPNVLQLLQNLGYQTFSEIIDESYNFETDDSKRLLMIADEIYRLSTLEGEQLENFLIKAREICDHNYNLLMSKLNSYNFVTKLT